MPEKAPTHRQGRTSWCASAAQERARKIRSSYRWIKCRRAVLARRPLCEGRWHGDREVAAVQVHHEIPLVERPDLAFTESNLYPLCTECHSYVEQQERGGMRVRIKSGSEKTGSEIPEESVPRTFSVDLLNMRFDI